MPEKLNVGVVFGGQSVEHEVSVITGLQAAAALDRSRYRPVPIYISKAGQWYTGGKELLEVDYYKDLEAAMRKAAPVRLVRGKGPRASLVTTESKGWLGGLLGEQEAVEVDVLFIALHGAAGENGSLQGLCETLNLPYTGSGVLGSALGMDKVLAKRLCAQQGIPVVDFLAFRESDWANQEETFLDRCLQELGLPLVVKPANLGSSIGISKVETREALDGAIEEVFRYSEKVLVEKAINPLREINCAVLGSALEARASVLEEPVRSEDDALLSYQDKYQGSNGSGKQGSKQETVAAGSKGGQQQGMAASDRTIPANISKEQTARIQTMAVEIFRLFEAGGVARIDFILDEQADKVYFNEINTIPGSFAFYLWEPTGIPFDELTHQMIELARERYQKAAGRLRTYDTNLLALKAGGVKTGEG